MMSPRHSTQSERGVIVALDTSLEDRATAWVSSLLPYTPYFKVGLELFSAAGPKVIEDVRHQGAKVFLDLKLHDIPNTVRHALRAIARQGVWMTTVHAAGGRDMLLAARSGLDDEEPNSAGSNSGRPLLIAVTVLTSVTVTDKTARDALALARLAQDCACDGVVCSAHEASAVRDACGPGFVIVTPGIRLQGADANDQRRVADPETAFRNGAHFVVMGRAITQASDPEAVMIEVKRGLL
jgi:orotidine-5'-phosphate decarboxylase